MRRSSDKAWPWSIRADLGWRLVERDGSGPERARRQRPVAAEAGAVARALAYEETARRRTRVDDVVLAVVGQALALAFATVAAALARVAGRAQAGRLRRDAMHAPLAAA